MFFDSINPTTNPSALSATQWLGNLTLTETWRHHIFGDSERLLLGVSWTLCYEEQFYIICGLLLVVSSTRFFLGVALVSALTFALTAYNFMQADWLFRGLFLDGRWLTFALGILVYLHTNYAGRNGRRIGVGVVLAAFLLSMAFRYGILSNGTNWEKKDRASSSWSAQHSHSY